MKRLEPTIAELGAGLLLGMLMFWAAFAGALALSRMGGPEFAAVRNPTEASR